MKLLFVSALLFLTAVNSVQASEFEAPFVLAMDYSAVTRLAMNDSFGNVKKTLSDSQTFEKKEAVVIPQKNVVEDENKWNTIKDFKAKPFSVSGEASFDAGDNMSIGAAAGYTFPEEDELTQKKTDKEYSLKINFEVAL